MFKRNFKYSEGRISNEELAHRTLPFTLKFQWFLSKGYQPHYFQWLFHTLQDETNEILRHRHLVAGRRGGKTVSAAWEVLFYCLHPEVFHTDVHGEESARPLHVWVLTKDYPAGLPAWRTMLEAIRSADVEARTLSTTRTIEFPNGSLIEFKTAVDPEGLRGAGLDIMWMDEAAFIPNADAYLVARPALSDHLGIILTTTTPSGKNWLYDEFWGDTALQDLSQGRVEYRSIDNPYFPKEEWEYVRARYHPMLFKQEYMAAFDALQGRELLGEWLKYYTLGDPSGDKIGVPRMQDSKELNLKYYIGVDPAISLADSADRFSISVIGVTPDSVQCYLIDNWAGRIPFPEQVDKIQEWFLKWRQKGLGVQFVAVEANAYQNALVQQLERLPSLPPIVPILSKGKKEERILRMSPLFRIGKVRIREDQRDFIDEWLDYDSTIKNPKDDVLDSVEIALSVASVMHAELPKASEHADFPAGDVNEWAKRDLPGRYQYRAGSYDESMGDDW